MGIRVRVGSLRRSRDHALALVDQRRLGHATDAIEIGPALARPLTFDPLQLGRKRPDPRPRRRELHGRGGDRRRRTADRRARLRRVSPTAPAAGQCPPTARTRPSPPCRRRARRASSVEANPPLGALVILVVRGNCLVMQGHAGANLGIRRKCTKKIAHEVSALCPHFMA